MEKKLSLHLTARKIGLILFSFITMSYNAQIGINTSKPHPSAALEINTDLKKGGLLLPRIALLSTDDLSTIPNPATNLIVYNTNNGGSTGKEVFADYLYHFNGLVWKRLTNRDDLMNSDDLPSVIAFGRKTTTETCNNTTSGTFNLNVLSNPTIISSSGEFTAPKDGYYSFSVFFEFSMQANAAQSFENSPYITAEGVTTYSTRFRGPTGYNNQPRTITGVVYLAEGDKTKPFTWNFGTGNNCGTAGRIKGQQVVWDYVGNPL